MQGQGGKYGQKHETKELVEFHNHLHVLTMVNIKIKGIFSRKEHMPKNHSPCIINLDSYENTGTHWVACAPFHENNKTLRYFDSFGMH